MTSQGTLSFKPTWHFYRPALDAEKSFDQYAAEAAFKNTAIPMMSVDRDLEITTLNNASHKLLEDNIDLFRTIHEEMDPDNMIGANIDLFHKHPENQRRLLSSPENLPYMTDISVGDFKFELKVGAIFDDDGDYIGNTLEWNDVTQARLNEGMLDAIERSQAVVEYSLDRVIRRVNENFERIYGLSAADVEGSEFSSIVSSETCNQDEQNHIWDRLAKGRMYCQRVSPPGSGWQRGLGTTLHEPRGGQERQLLQSGRVLHRCYRTQARRKRSLPHGAGAVRIRRRSQ